MLVVIRGAGDIASGIAVRLRRAGADIVMLDIPVPTAVRRAVCFSEAIRLGKMDVEGIHAVRCKDATAAVNTAASGTIAVLADPEGSSIRELSPDAVVDAILAKRNVGTTRDMAPIVIGVGPGFHAGTDSSADCHAAVETKRGHYLGRVIYDGSPIPNTGVPGNIGGFSTERVLRAPTTGTFEPVRRIGDVVKKGDLVATVNGAMLYATIDGVLRGLLQEGVPVTRGMKSGDIDPRCKVAHCFSCSDKARAVGGGVLEALLHFSGRLEG
jgi:xanthine dehydrogenase accessory factor